MKRKQALKLGLTEYQDDKPCKNGHTGLRHITRGCLECERTRHRVATPEKRAAQNEASKARYHAETEEQKAHRAELQAKWKADNQERIQQYSEKTKLKQKAERAALKAELGGPTRARPESASKLPSREAMPPWADWDKIDEFYEQARETTRQTGVPHAVDHVVPLRGENVCGLHVENNLQVLTRRYNSFKSNRHRPDGRPLYVPGQVPPLAA